MRFIPKYRVGYNDKFYEAGSEFWISSKDIDEMRKHGTVLNSPAALSSVPKKPGRPRRTKNE